MSDNGPHAESADNHTTSDDIATSDVAATTDSAATTNRTELPHISMTHAISVVNTPTGVDPSRRIRHAVMDDLPTIRAVYALARKEMAADGNPTQWGDRYPLESTVLEDLKQQRTMLLVDEVDGRERVLAQFAACQGPEAYYAQIRGQWLNDKDYWVLHRIASAGLARQTTRDCIAWMVERFGTVRADTHPNNRIMQHVLTSNGFVRCGLVTLPDRDEDAERIAYQWHDAGNGSAAASISTQPA